MPEPDAPCLLELDGLCAAYGAIHVLSGISLRVHTGEIVTLLGANGAGKTTTLMSISGIHRQVQGHIRFAGEDILGLPAYRIVERGLAQVPEGRKIFPRMSIAENLRLGSFTRSLSAAELHHDYDKVFTLFPILAERRHQLGGTLSGGEQQMLAIGRALMSRPRLLVMDEPSMGVAPLLVQNIFAAIQALNHDGLSVLLVEQNARLALRVAARGYVLETGRVVLAGDAGTLRDDPRVRAAYLGE
jgi:branched-chain amino acid transport system ATP-binding protein